MIEFIESEHLYVVDGVILPSVTRVTSWQLGNEYKNVPQSILDQAADYGTRMHEWLQKYFRDGVKDETTDTMLMSTEQIPDIFDGHAYMYLESEKAVQYANRVAGMFDLLLKMDGEITLIDHKTTAKIHEESLSWQCGIYKLGIEQELGVVVEKCYCLWLPKKKKVKLVEVNPKSKEEIDDLLDRWEKAHE